MIRRSANKEGAVTYNISFHSPRQGNSPCRIESDSALQSLNHLRTSYLSVKSNPVRSIDFEDCSNKGLRVETRSLASEFDCLELDDLPSVEDSMKYFPSPENNLETNPKLNAEEFFTQEPIDFEELQKYGGRFERDDEEKSSASTVSRDSKKIMKGKTGVVYKESRFKEEARNKGTKRQPWQSHEDEKVIELVSKHGQSWALIASMMEGRSGKQIRDRYLNKLRPDIKIDEWNKEEDQQLINFFHEHGRKWSKIATLLPGRTEGQVKNRFYSHISKRMLGGNGDFNSEGPNTPMSAKRLEETEGVSSPYVPSNFAQATQYQTPDTLASVQDQQKPQDINDFMQTLSFDFPSDFPNVDQHGNFGTTQAPAMHHGDPFFVPADPADIISYDRLSPNQYKKSPQKFFGNKGHYDFEGRQGSEFQEMNHTYNQDFDFAGTQYGGIEKSSPMFFAGSPLKMNRVSMENSFGNNNQHFFGDNLDRTNQQRGRDSLFYGSLTQM